MQFSPTKTKRDLSAAVAYIDSDGDLIIRDRSDSTKAIGLGSGHVYTVYANLTFDPEYAEDGQVFYPGDSITITF